jgi:hypothetical protein
MKVLVGVKRVVDYAVKVRVSKGKVDPSSLKQSMNPFCEVSTLRRHVDLFVSFALCSDSISFRCVCLNSSIFW